MADRGVIGEAFVRVRPDTKGFAGETKRGLSSALKSGAAIAGVSVGLAGGIKLVRDSVKAAKEADTIQRQAAAATKAAGNAWETYGAQVEAAANKQAKLQSFDDEEIVQAYTRIVTTVGDVGRSLELASLAGDLASFKMVNGQRDLASAATVVAKVAGGNVGILKRYGITLRDGATASEALAELQKLLAGRAEAFAAGSEGAQARLNKVFGDTQEIVGGALLPTIDRLSRRLADYIEEANESGEVQRRVNEVVATGEKVIRGFAGGLEQVHAIAGPVVSALGGVEKVVKAVVVAFAVSKVVKFAVALRGAALAFGLVGTSSRGAAAGVAAFAAAETASAGATAAATTATAARTAGILRFAKAGGALLAISTALNVSDKKKRNEIVEDAKRGQLGSAAFNALFGTDFGIGDPAKPPTAKEQQQQRLKPFPVRTRVKDLFGIETLTALLDAKEAPIDVLTGEVTKKQLADPKVRKFIKDTFGQETLNKLDVAFAGAPKRPEEGAGARSIGAFKQGATTSTATGGGAVRLTFKQVESRIAGFEESQLDAQLARSVADERRQLTREESFLREQLKDTKRSAEQRRRLKDELLDVQGQIERIDSDIAQAKSATAEKKAAVASKAAAAVKSANAAALKASGKQFEADLRGAGISAAAHITGIITGKDPTRLGVFSTGRAARDGTSTASGVTGTSSANTVSIDQLLRDLAVGQAQRDRLQLDQAVETNRLLRILAPGAQAPAQRRRGRGIERLTGIEAARETATLTGGLP